MGEKNPRSMMNKASWTLMEGIKDAVTNNVATALKTGQIKVEAKEATKLLQLLGASVEEGYHRGAKSFDKTVDSAVSLAEMPPAVLARRTSRP